MALSPAVCPNPVSSQPPCMLQPRIISAPPRVPQPRVISAASAGHASVRQLKPSVSCTQTHIACESKPRCLVFLPRVLMKTLKSEGWAEAGGDGITRVGLSLG